MMINQKIKVVITLIILTLTVLCVSCAGLGNLIKDAQMISINLGKATEYDLAETIPRALRKYQFQILDTYDTGGYYTIETDWKHRFPYEDEKEMGIIDGKLRLFFRIRKLTDSSCYVRLEVENMLRTSEEATWFYASMSNMVGEEIDRLVEELKREFAESRLRRT